MNQDFIQCLADDVNVRADIAVNLIYEYRDGKDPMILKFAASGIYQMAHRVLMIYGLVRDNHEYFSLNFDEMAERVSNSCEDGVFLRHTDVSAWDSPRGCKPADMTWDESYDYLLTYAKKVQYLYNNDVVSQINCDSDDEFYSSGPRRRVSNFN